MMFAVGAIILTGLYRYGGLGLACAVLTWSLWTGQSSQSIANYAVFTVMIMSVPIAASFALTAVEGAWGTNGVPRSLRVVAPTCAVVWLVSGERILELSSAFHRVAGATGAVAMVSPLIGIVTSVALCASIVAIVVTGVTVAAELPARWFAAQRGVQIPIDLRAFRVFVLIGVCAMSMHLIGGLFTTELGVARLILLLRGA